MKSSTARRFSTSMLIPGRVSLIDPKETNSLLGIYSYLSEFPFLRKALHLHPLLWGLAGPQRAKRSSVLSGTSSWSLVPKRLDVGPLVEMRQSLKSMLVLVYSFFKCFETYDEGSIESILT